MVVIEEGGYETNSQGSENWKRWRKGVEEYRTAPGVPPSPLALRTRCILLFHANFYQLRNVCVIFFSPKEDPNNKYEFKKFQKQIHLSWELNPVIQKQVVVLGQD